MSRGHTVKRVNLSAIVSQKLHIGWNLLDHVDPGAVAALLNAVRFRKDAHCAMAPRIVLASKVVHALQNNNAANGCKSIA